MSEHAQEAEGQGTHHDGHEGEHDTNYVRVWVWLVILLVISVAGPLLEIFWVTMVTAFGIACVKAYMVVTKFMHISMEPRYVTYIVVTALVFMLLFFAATAPDVMQAEGTQWLKPTWMSGEPE